MEHMSGRPGTPESQALAFCAMCVTLASSLANESLLVRRLPPPLCLLSTRLLGLLSQTAGLLLLVVLGILQEYALYVTQQWHLLLSVKLCPPPKKTCWTPQSVATQNGTLHDLIFTIEAIKL